MRPSAEASDRHERRRQRRGLARDERVARQGKAAKRKVALAVEAFGGPVAAAASLLTANEFVDLGFAAASQLAGKAGKAQRAAAPRPRTHGPPSGDAPADATAKAVATPTVAAASPGAGASGNGGGGAQGASGDGEAGSERVRHRRITYTDAGTPIARVKASPPKVLGTFTTERQDRERREASTAAQGIGRRRGGTSANHRGLGVAGPLMPNQLNQSTMKDRHPLPDIPQLLDAAEWMREGSSTRLYAPGSATMASGPDVGGVAAISASAITESTGMTHVCPLTTLQSSVMMTWRRSTPASAMTAAGLANASSARSEGKTQVRTHNRRSRALAGSPRPC